LTKFQADAELREAERKQARADLQRQHDDQQGAAARNSETWHTWADARADARILAHTQKDGLIHEPVGAALGEYTLTKWLVTLGTTEAWPAPAPT
jgi:hypothetical protein